MVLNSDVLLVLGLILDSVVESLGMVCGLWFVIVIVVVVESSRGREMSKTEARWHESQVSEEGICCTQNCCSHAGRGCVSDTYPPGPHATCGI